MRQSCFREKFTIRPDDIELAVRVGRSQRSWSYSQNTWTSVGQGQ